MWVRVVATFVVTGVVAIAGAAPFEPARTFLVAAFNLSAAEIGRLDHGEVV